MIEPGVVLSQPVSRMVPSIGLPRRDSSTSMLSRLRKSIAVGRSIVSPSDITGNSSGNPPACQTPALDRLGEPAQVRVARRQLGPGVADPDHRPPVEHLVREPLRPHPRPVDEPVPVLLPEPVVESSADRVSEAVGRRPGCSASAGRPVFSGVGSPPPAARGRQVGVPRVGRSAGRSVESYGDLRGRSRRSPLATPAAGDAGGLALRVRRGALRRERPGTRPGAGNGGPR